MNTKSKKNKLLSLIVFLTFVFFSTFELSAATVAYWRFEEGTAGTKHPGNQDDFYQDSSGNGNHLSSWTTAKQPTYTDEISAAKILQTDTQNNLALDFISHANCLRTAANKPINSYIFNNGWTVECTFKLRDLGWRVIMGKDGDPRGAAGAESPFWLKIRDFDKRLEVLFFDNTTNFRVAATLNPIEIDKWYSVAAVCDGSQTKLYLKSEEDSSYKLQSTVSGFNGATLGQWNQPWTVGRGMWDGAEVDFIDGIIDEVRISDLPLAPTEFLALVDRGVNSDTLAYWRFEDGVAGWANPNYRSNVFLDSSTNGNYLWCYEVESSPVYSSDVLEGEIPESNSTNLLSLDFTPNTELYTRNKPLNSHNFSSGWTVECMAKFDSYGWQVLINKDGNPDITFGPAIFQLKFRDDNHKLDIEFFDGGGVYRTCLSSSAINLDTWYYIAAVCDGSTAKLYLKEKNDAVYSEVASLAGVSGGALYSQESFWSVGRGMWKGGISDWVDGHIDEVRISNGALPPQQFLGSPIPEPGTVFLILSFVILIFCFRKKKLSIKSVSAIISFIFIFAISSHATTNINWGPLTHVANGGYSRMADLSDGSLLFASERNAGANNELFGLRSYNDGTNWTDETRVSAVKTSHNYANSFPLQLQNGKILYACRNHIYNNGVWLYRLGVYASDDLGKSWHYYSVIEEYNYSESETESYHGVWEPFLIQLPNGTLQAYYADGRIPGIGMRMSYDNGLTWSSKIVVAQGSSQSSTHGMPATIRLSDGKLICVFESSVNASPNAVIIRMATSTDGGATWSATSKVYEPHNAVSARWNASAPYIAKMSDGTLFVSFQTDEDVVYQSGDPDHDPANGSYEALAHCSFKYTTSSDGGASWSTDSVWLAGSPTDSKLWNALFISGNDTLFGITSGADIRVGHEIP